MQHAESQPEVAFLDLITCGEMLSNFFEYNKDNLLVKRRFVKTIRNLLNPYFFQQTETTIGILNESDISDRIEAAYDLRSYYVHSGVNFGGWVRACRLSNSGRVVGVPDIKDKELKKILDKSPTTFSGLERIMRYCLLRFIHLYGTPIDDRLDGDGL